MKKRLINFLFFLILIIFSACFSYPARAATVGIQQAFYVDSSYDAFGRTSLTATLQEISERAYFYTEDDWWNSLGSVNGAKLIIHNLALEFDQKIYPKLTEIYGTPWEPGIDGDPKITILISRIQEGAGGYFNSADEYTRSRAPLSNEREMLYLNAFYYNSLQAKSFLAHEFQHLINFYQKEKFRGVTEEIWLNEARSEYAPTLLGYDDVLPGSYLEKRISDFLKNPSDSLTEWSGNVADYGSINLFMQYLVNHFGEQILTKIIQSPLVGITSIDSALKSLGFNETFSSVFVNWTIANYLNDCRIEGQKYCYLNNDLSTKMKILPTVNQNLPASGSFSASWIDFVKDWSGHWYKFIGGNNNLKIEFKGGEDTNFMVAYVIEKINGGKEVKFIKLDSSQQGIASVQNLRSDVSSVVLIPVSQTKKSGFGGLEPFRQFFYQVDLIEEFFKTEESSPSTVMIPSYFDGSLIKAIDDYKVYIIKGDYKRWIQDGEIFNFYGHFSWSKVTEALPEELSVYKESFLVRADGDTKVYEINGDGTKHWLNMTAQQFSASGRKWDMVYVINNQERDWYRTGADVIFK